MKETPPILRTIPSDDDGFREHVLALAARISPQRPYDLGSRLRRLFPRVFVRERQLSGEPLTWYVYRDGAWSHDADPQWWLAPNVPRMVASVDGWITEANASARGLLGLPDDMGPRHFTDFVAPGTLEDATQLFGVILRGNALTVTLLLKPVDGNVIACEAHVERQDGSMVAYLRLTDPVTVPDALVARPAALVCEPESDAALFVVCAAPARSHARADHRRFGTAAAPALPARDGFGRHGYLDGASRSGCRRRSESRLRPRTGGGPIRRYRASGTTSRA